MVKAQIARYVGVDPGSRNYAIAGLDSRGDLVFAHMLEDTVWSTAQAHVELRTLHWKAMRKILDQLRPSAVIMESFVVRGFGANSIELVALMNGSLQSICKFRGIEEHMVTASTWKREFKKYVSHDGLQEWYDYARERGVPPHVVDALCLATYLRGGKTFAGASKRLLQANVKRAAHLVQPDRKIKPKRKVGV